MVSPFQDKICTFVGNIRRCSRAEAKERLFAVGGVPVDDVNSCVDYVITGVAFEKLKKYKEAQRLYRRGHTNILTEEQFFDILETGAEPPENPNRDTGVVEIIPARDSDAPEPGSDYLKSKRMAYLANKKIPLADGGYMRIDPRPAIKAANVIRIMNENLKDNDKN